MMTLRQTYTKMAIGIAAGMAICLPLLLLVEAPWWVALLSTIATSTFVMVLYDLRLEKKRETGTRQ